ncbi:MAG: FecR domain-containing protein [Bacteroidota bacterium]
MKITDELLKKYANGQCSKEEKQLVEKWLATEGDSDGEDQSHLFDPYKAQTWDTLSKQTIERRTTFKQRAMRYAAAIALFISLGAISYLLFNPSNESTGETILAMEDFQTIYSERGERQTISLPDGSTVRLNTESILKFPQEFEGKERLVYLEGHAHFDIQRNPEKPFIVYTEDSRTQVLGTSFDINTHSTSQRTEIIVTSGKVAFSERDDTKNTVKLTVNKRAILAGENNIQVDEVDAESLTAWKQDRLVLEKMTLAEIIKVIEPWYDVNVEVNNPNLMTIKYKVSKDNPTLEALMDDLSLLGGFVYEIEGKTVTID